MSINGQSTLEGSLPWHGGLVWSRFCCNNWPKREGLKSRSIQLSGLCQERSLSLRALLSMICPRIGLYLPASYWRKLLFYRVFWCIFRCIYRGCLWILSRTCSATGYRARREQPNILFITFEEMKIRRTAEFLDKTLTDEEVERLQFFRFQCSFKEDHEGPSKPNPHNSQLKGKSHLKVIWARH